MSSAGSPVVLLMEGNLSVLIYLKIVLCCSVLFYVALTEFAFSVVDSGMTESYPTLVTCIIICSNLGMCCCLLTGMKMHHWRNWFCTKQSCRIAGQWKQHVRFVLIAFLVRSFAIALCWNCKVYWCLKDFPAWYFQVISTSVTITVLLWRWPGIHDILVLYINSETFDCKLRVTGKFLVSKSLHMSVYQSAGQCLCFKCWIQFHINCFWFDFIHYCISLKQITGSNKEVQCITIYSLMSSNWFSVGSPVVAVVKGKLPVQGLEGFPAMSHQPCSVGLKFWTIYQECLNYRCVTLVTARGVLR